MEVCVISSVCSFTFLCMDVPLSQNRSLRRVSLLRCIEFSSLLQLTIFVSVYFWILYSVPLIYLSVLTPTPHCLDYCSCKSFLKVSEGFPF